MIGDGYLEHTRVYHFQDIFRGQILIAFPDIYRFYALVGKFNIQLFEVFHITASRTYIDHLAGKIARTYFFFSASSFSGSGGTVSTFPS